MTGCDDSGDEGDRDDTAEVVDVGHLDRIKDRIVVHRVSNYRTLGRPGVKLMTASWVLYFLSYKDVVFRMTGLADETVYGGNTI